MAMMLAGCAGGRTTGSSLPAGTLGATSPLICGQAPAGTAVPPVVYLSPGQNLSQTDGCNAQYAFRQGSAVVLQGGTDGALLNALGLDPASTGALASNGTAGNNVFTSATSPPALSFFPFTLRTVALRTRPSGEVSAFHAFDITAQAAAASLQTWLGLPGDPAIGSWVPQFSDYVTASNYFGNAQQTTTYYRLAEFNTSSDWYLVSAQLTGSPQYLGCDLPTVGSGAVGWYNLQRTVKIIPGTNQGINLVEHGPNTTAGSSSTSFSIGTKIAVNASGPQGEVNATFSQSFSTPDVVVKDLSNTSNTQTELDFTGPSFQPFHSGTCPPATATSNYTSQQAAIWQVPEGQPLAVTVPGNAYSSYANSKALVVDATFSYNYQALTWQSQYTLRPPTFTVSNNSIQMNKTPGTTAQFSIVGSVPGAGQQLGWAITNIPSWLVVSQLTGVGNATITLTVQGGAPPSSTAFLNINTNPLGAANSVETAPLIIKVQSSS